MNRLLALQTQLQAAEAAAAAILARSETDSPAPLADVNAATEALATARAELAAHQKLLDMQRKEPPVASTRQPLTAEPLVAQDPRRGFASMGHYMVAIKQDCLGRRAGIPVAADERLQVINAESRFEMSAAVPGATHSEGHSEDGLMVPPEFRREIWRPAFELDDLLSLLRIQTTSSPVVEFTADETTPWGAAGLQAYWGPELGQMTASRTATQPRSCRLHKLHVMCITSNELEMDTALLNSRVSELAPQAIAWKIGEAIFRGTGAGQPLGFENGGSLVTVAKETAQAATTLVTANVAKMAARVIAGAGSRLVWLLNRDTIPQLIALSIGNEPSWVAQNQGLKDAPNGMLLGSPLFFTEHAKTLGTVGDISLVNLAGLLFFMHSSGTKFDTSIHLHFDYDAKTYKWTLRCGGMPYLSAAITPAQGSATRSHSIQLATRA